MAISFAYENLKKKKKKEAQVPLAKDLFNDSHNNVKLRYELKIIPREDKKVMFSFTKGF